MKLYEKETPDFADTEILFGLDARSTNQEIMDKAWNILKEIRSMPAATVRDGLPESRVIDFCVLSDNNPYFIASKGKALHQDLSLCPYIVLCHRYGRWTTFRLRAKVEICSDDKKAWDEFFSYNQGTATMYGDYIGILDLFKLVSGEGELFQLWADDKLKRARFSFGGAEPKPYLYDIDEAKCTGCGACVPACCESAIHHKDGRYIVSHMDCNECGKCYVACPEGAITCRLWSPEQKKTLLSS